MKRAKILTHIGTIVLISSIAVISGLAQDVEKSLFKEADEAMKAAKEARAELLAPQAFLNGLEAYREAQSEFRAGKDLGGIRAKLNEAVSSFRQATESTQLAAVAFEGVMKVRSQASKAEAAQYAKESWLEAERKFADAAGQLEDGDADDAKELGAEAENLFRSAELEAIKTHHLTEIWKLLKQAEGMDVDDQAPRTMKLAKDLATQSEKELDQNRYDTDYARSLALKARYEVQHAMELSKAIKGVKANNLSLEDVMLKSEEPIRTIATAAEIDARFDEGLEKAAAPVAVYVQQLRDSAGRMSQELAFTKNENENLRAQLSGATEEQADLMREMEKQEEVRQQFLKVENTFDRSEAMVLREGDNVIVRLVGLNFDVGKSEIKPEGFELLKKVENSINTFPGCDVTVEGHTDSHGGDRMNLQLSQKRADAVMAYLLANMSLEASRIKAIGFGEVKPIANNETSEGRARNRRIDVVIHP
jgi:outer membrane protein OmpA-like peptidoglycan-associated protein